MNTYKLFAVALAMVAPTAAQADSHDAGQAEVIRSVEYFLTVQGMGNGEAMRTLMTPDAKISIRRVGNVKGKRAEVLTPKRYIKRVTSWDNRTAERMTFTKVEVTGDRALVEGPYVFTVDGEVTHCGINSLGLVKIDGAWKLGDSTYLIVPPEDCAEVGAPSPQG